MTDPVDLDLGRRSRRLRVDTLVRLRWLAVCGQAIAVLVVRYVLGFPIPLGLCLLFIAGSAWLNILLRLRFGRSDRLEDPPAAAMLAYDIIQLSALLYLTGGLENPFAILFLAPIMIAAVSFSGLITLDLTLLMVAAATALTFTHYPLPWFPGETLELPVVYSLGIWVAITVGAAFHGDLCVAHRGGNPQACRRFRSDRTRHRARTTSDPARRSRRRGGT